MHSAGITVADSHFHQKIIDRYQKGKSNIFQLPHLMFLKNKRRILSLKINVDVSVRIFNKLNKIFTITTEKIYAKKSIFSLIQIEHQIQHYIFRRYTLEGDLADNILLYHQYHEKELMPNTGDIWSANMQTVQLKFNSRKQSSYCPEAFYNVLLQGADQPISQYITPEYGSKSIQFFPYNTGQHFTKIKSIPDTRNVPSSIIRNIHRMMNNRIHVDSAFYPESVYNVLLQGAAQPISQNITPEYRSQSIQRFPYNTGQHLTKTITIPDKTDILSSIIRNIHRMVNNRIQVDSAFYPESVYNVLLQGAAHPISQYITPEYGSQIKQRFPYNIGKYFKKTMTNPERVTSTIIRNIYQMVNSRKQVASSFYPEAVYNVLLQGADQPISQYLMPEYGSQSIQGSGQDFTKIISFRDNRDVKSTILRNIYQIVNSRKQVVPALYPEAFHKVLLQDSDQPFENYQYSEPSSIFSFPERPSIGTSAELLYFNDQRNVEQEIEEVKKIAIDVRDAVRERSASIHPSGDTDLKKHLDIHRLSEQVYQNIEQRIRIEKERRGL
jgi:predicted component of type VI protein secretion system